MGKITISKIRSSEGADHRYAAIISLFLPLRSTLFLLSRFSLHLPDQPEVAETVRRLDEILNK